MKKTFKIGILVLTLGVAALGIWMFSSFKATESDLHNLRRMSQYHQDVSNQRTIAKAVVDYIRANAGEFPNSLENLVATGFLPEKGSFYVSPYSMEWGDIKSYKESHYSLDVSKKTVYRNRDVNMPEPASPPVNSLIMQAIRQSQP